MWGKVTEASAKAERERRNAEREAKKVEARLKREAEMAEREQKILDMANITAKSSKKKAASPKGKGPATPKSAGKSPGAAKSGGPPPSTGSAASPKKKDPKAEAALAKAAAEKAIADAKAGDRAAEKQRKIEVKAAAEAEAAERRRLAKVCTRHAPMRLNTSLHCADAEKNACFSFNWVRGEALGKLPPGTAHFVFMLLLSRAGAGGEGNGKEASCRS